MKTIFLFLIADFLNALGQTSSQIKQSDNLAKKVNELVAGAQKKGIRSNSQRSAVNKSLLPKVSFVIASTHPPIN